MDTRALVWARPTTAAYFGSRPGRGRPYARGMRAARYLTGGPDAGVLEIVDRDVPEPGPGEVRVRVSVSGVNPTDWKSRKGGGLTAAGLDEVIPNQDGAGVVEAVGAGVDERRVGERVWLWLAQWQRATARPPSSWRCRPSRRSRCPTAARSTSAPGSGSRR